MKIVPSSENLFQRIQRGFTRSWREDNTFWL